MNKLDVDKDRIVGALRHARRQDAQCSTSGAPSARFSSGCGSATASTVVGVDFKDLSRHPSLGGVEFHRGLFYEALLASERFDLVTMWHFLEHDYDPMRSLRTARRVLKPGGTLVIEVPRLDSRTFALVRQSLAGAAGPAAHGAARSRASARDRSQRAGLEVVDYLPYGAFPAYFYLFTGTVVPTAERARARPRPRRSSRTSPGKCCWRRSSCSSVA